ncbi:MAG TPA: DNA polymerase I [Thermoleophilaceae bacterium]|nr:DNA polymerase I [Thermoleophilaceae bacterium]
MPPQPPKELFLIDGNSLVYRAFFALPESIATSRGQPTNAIFGFASMLVKLLTEFGPKPTIVVWDAGASGRKEVYPEYKGDRPSRPDLLREQFPHFTPLVEAFGYMNVSCAGYEADDVIATLARRAREHGTEVMIVTGDRDTFQLVEDGVRVMATGRGITDTKIYDRQAVIDRYGIEPELIPDFYGLKGDTSDNIPGVPGIGDKTAATLLQQFGDLESILASVDQISGAKRKQNLVDHAEDARISKQLATSIRDVPVDAIDLDHLLAREPDRARLREVFREFELRDPLRRLEEALGDGEAAAPMPAASETVAVRVRRVEPAALATLSGDHPALWADRPEPPEGQLPGMGDDAPLTFAAYGGNKEALAGEAETLTEVVAAWGDRPLTVHDWKTLTVSEQPVASWATADDDGGGPAISAPPLQHDTLVAAYLIDPARRSYPLDELASDLGLGAEIQGATGEDRSKEAAEQAVLLHALAARQRETLDELGLTRLLEEVELPLVEVLVEMERAGVRLDVGRVREIATRIGDEATALERRIWEAAGEEFTIGSPQQLAEILFTKLELSKKRRGKTGFSTDARVLAAIRHEHEIIPMIEEWRELTKLKSTYLDAFPSLLGDDGRLRTTFSQVTAATGRLSSSNPNLQNIPVRTERGREIRACFVAEDGCRLISADYSQVELRLLAHIAGEEVLKEIFRRGEDVHTATAAWILGDDGEGPVDPGTRSKAKMVNYGIVYGLSAFGLADRLQIPQEEAQQFIDRYLERFPAVKAFIDSTVERATDEGFVATEFGRIRRIPELRARNRQTRMLGERLAVNMVIQGTAADIIKVAMVNSVRALRDAGLRTRLVLQIHDELLFEGPGSEVADASTIVQREMAAAFEMDPPLDTDVGVGTNWLEAK